MIKHVVLYLFFLSCTCLVQAQDFNIRGTVFEEETGMGLMEIGRASCRERV